MTSSNPTKVGSFQESVYRFDQRLPCKCGGNLNGKTRISTFQPNYTQFRRKDSDCQNWKSLQIQHQLSHHLDSEVSEESINWKGEFKKIVNFFLITKYFDKESKEYKDCFEILKQASPYTCCSCNNKSGLSFIEPKHNCKFPMFDKEHMPIEEYLIKRCDEYGWSWEKIDEYFKTKTKEVRHSSH